MSGVWSSYLGTDEGNGAAGARKQQPRRHEAQGSGGSYQALEQPQIERPPPSRDYQRDGRRVSRLSPENQELLGAGPEYYRESVYSSASMPLGIWSEPKGNLAISSTASQATVL
ncbi:hypothetical protein D9611_010611 [Ephemerocybe angulata]|uniref:Uncharacterized protein n=1 Tax=Ephemerocybe angulata TaxID=980116 RepID=A0A8H5BXJ6_9AGAR|nr:hypothetical protein D9611_010611 [Tulosesus angulatus]